MVRLASVELRAVEPALYGADGTIGILEELLFADDWNTYNAPTPVASTAGIVFETVTLPTPETMSVYERVYPYTPGEKVDGIVNIYELLALIDCGMFSSCATLPVLLNIVITASEISETAGLPLIDQINSTGESTVPPPPPLSPKAVIEDG